MSLQSIIMKTCPTVALLCVSMLFAGASAQEPSAEELQRQFEYELRKLQSPRNQLQLEANYLARYHSDWIGQGTANFLSNVALRRDSDLDLGLTEEQKSRLSFLDHDKYGEWLRQLDWQNIPEAVQAEAAYKAAHMPDDYLFERATEEQKKTYREAMVAAITYSGAVTQRELQETLTPEQMFRVRTWEMQSMAELGLPHPAMFEILDLTDDQKKEMDKIAKEIKVEFDRLVIEFAALHFKMESAGYQLLEGKSFVSREEFDKALREARISAGGKEIDRQRAFEKPGVELMTLMRDRMMNVLTDAQLDRMQEILDATPEYLKRRIAGSRTQREAAKKSPTYVPGPGAWRPGDPMPMQFQEERRRSRFPKTEN
jgi:hypothetical protein